MSGPSVALLEKAVQSTISSLGYLDRGVYRREPDCYGKVIPTNRLITIFDRRHT